MTKKQLMEAMGGLDDDTEIYVYCTSPDMDGGQFAYDVYIDDIVSGDDVQNELTIVAHF